MHNLTFIENHSIRFTFGRFYAISDLGTG